MKKIFIIITFLTICLLGGCQNTNSTTTEQSSVTPSPIETEKITTTPSLTPTPTPTPSETAVEQRENTDFRNTKWGDNRETIIENENIELIETEEGLVGEDRVNDLDTWVIYVTDNNDKLYRALYDFNKLNYSNAGQYIPVYNGLKDSLTEKYGEPIGDGIFNLANEETIALAGEERALKLGYIAYSARWETDTTLITIGLMAQNYDIHLIIQYEDKNYEPDINDSGL